MTTFSPISPVQTTSTVAATPLEPAARRRRRATARIHALSDAGAGAAALAAPVQQLPFAARASVRVSNGLLYPVLGAVLGTFLLGPIGTIAGGIAGWLLAR